MPPEIPRPERPGSDRPRAPRVRGGQAFDELLAGARRGEAWAWTRIVEEISADLLGDAQSKGVDSPEDGVADVVAAMAEKIHRFEGTAASFRSWVFTIAHHKIVDEIRRVRRRPRQVPLDDERLTHLTVIASTGDTSSDDSVEPGSAMDLLRLLPSDQRDVMYLTVVGELSAPEIARVLGKRPGAIRALQLRARRRLSQLLAQESDESEGRA